MNGRDERPITGEASPGCEVVCRDRLIAVPGQADFDSFAQTPHPADPRAQVVAVVGRIRERLERVGADLCDLTKLVVFHVPGPGCREWEMRDLLARALGPDVLTTLTMVPLPRLVSPGLLVMVDAYAMRGAGGRRIERAPVEVPGLASLPEPFCHGLRCEEFIFASGQSALDERGEVLFAGDLPSQNRYALDGVAAILDGLGANPGDIVKFNTWRADQTELVMRYVAQVLGAAGACFDDVLKLNSYYCHSVGAGALQGGAEARSRRFSPPGPALSDVPVEELAYPGMLVEIEAIAAIGPRRGVEPR